MITNILKIVIVGDGGVGKTTFIHRYLKKKFEPKIKLTIGIEHFIKNLNINHQIYKLQIWDLGGQERFRFMMNNFISGLIGALILFDMSNYNKTMDSVINEWIPLIFKVNHNIPILLIGTKYDLILNNNEYNKSLIDKFANEIKQKFNLKEYIKISSKSGKNIELPFEILTRNIIKYKVIKKI